MKRHPLSLCLGAIFFLGMASAELTNNSQLERFQNNDRHQKPLSHIVLKQAYKIMTGEAEKSDLGNELYQKARNYRLSADAGNHADYVDAVIWYQEAISAGNIDALNELGLLYLYGRGVEKNQRQAFDYFVKSGEAGDHLGLYNAGMAYYFGRGVKTNCVKARQYFEKAAKRGNMLAQFNLGVIYEDGIQTPVNLNRALINYQKAAKQGYVEAQYNLGLLYANKKFHAYDARLSHQFLLQAARQYHGKAAYHVGLNYQLGSGVERDYEKAHKYYQNTIRLMPHDEAYFRLGNLYENGLGVKKSVSQAIYYYFKASEFENGVLNYQLGFPYAKRSGQDDDIQDEYLQSLHYANLSALQGQQEAYTALGYIYNTGLGVDIDHYKAVSYYKIASEMGGSLAQYSLGLAYEYGRGIEKNYHKAKEQYQLSGNNGYSSAFFRLGGLYEGGFGVVQDYDKALLYYQMAALKDSKGADCAYDRVLKIIEEKESSYQKVAVYLPEIIKQLEATVTELHHEDALYYLAILYKHQLEAPNLTRANQLLESLALARHNDSNQESKTDIKRGMKAYSQTYESATVSLNQMIQALESLAVKNEGRAQYYLALFYHYGIGVSQDRQKADAYYEEALIYADQSIRKKIIPLMTQLYQP